MYITDSTSQLGHKRAGSSEGAQEPLPCSKLTVVLGDISPCCAIKNGRITMDWNRVEGNWKQVKGQVKEKWGKLTDDELDKMNGRREQLEGKIQERYGIAKDQAKKDVDAWYNSIKW